MRHASFRSLTLGVVGSILVSMSSMYVALRMGALPWPTVFSALVAFFVLREIKGSSMNEVNVAHTGMSAGGLVAGGMAFTVPAIWMAGKDLSLWKITLAGLVGVILGVGLTDSMRRKYIVQQDLPFPMGIAAAQTLKAGDEGGRKAKLLFSWMGISAVFTFLRDGLKLIPVVVGGFGMFPMAIGIGFIIGALYTLSWFFGGLTTSFLSLWISVDTLKKLGIGILIGSGMAMAVSGSLKSGLKFGSKSDLLIVLVAYAVSFALGLDPVSGAVFVLLSYVVVVMAGAVDGTTGIDPMEVFAIIVLSLTRLIGDFGIGTAVLMACAVAVATGLAGDALQDLKTGRFFKTDPGSQIFSELIGALVGVAVSAVVLFTIRKAYGGFGPETDFPAPQAFAVFQVISSSDVPLMFWLGAAIGFTAQIFRIPALTFGIGMYLPMFITLPVALGGAIRIVVERFYKNKVESGVVVSSGVLGGEGITGVIIGIFLALFRTLS